MNERRRTGNQIFQRLCSSLKLVPVGLLVVTVGIGFAWNFRTAKPLPQEAVLRSEGWADERRCADCHEQASEFHETGHAMTLSKVDDEASLSLLYQLTDSEKAVDEGLEIVHDSETKTLRAVQKVGGQVHELELGWCFGSGRHARTWVGTLNDSWGATDLVEFRWSWYHQLDGFDVTPGQPLRGVGGYFNGLGVLYDHPKTRRCFACHSSYLPIHEGRLDQDNLKPGVTCQRCHGPRAEHVATQGAVTDPFWRSATQHDSVNRCAECHRRADEQDPEDIHTDNVEIVRFQPVGLVQSACFKNSSTMTCITCHNPHRSLEKQDSLGIWQCVQCHDPGHESQTTCSARQIDDCLRCHMPKVASDAPIEFTDHWIRIRENVGTSR